MRFLFLLSWLWLGSIGSFVAQAQSKAVDDILQQITSQKPSDKRWELLESYLFYHPQTPIAEWQRILKKTTNFLNDPNMAGIEQAAIWRIRAFLFLEMEQPDQAKEELDKALQLYSGLASNKHYGTFIAHWLMGEYIYYLQKPEEAIPWFKLAEEFAPSDSLLLFSLSAHAKCLNLQGDYSAALKLRFRCVELAERYNKPYHVAKNYMYMGDLYMRMPGEEEKAAEYLLKSIYLLRDHPEMNLLAQAYASLATIYVRQKQYTKATLLLDSSIILLERVERPAHKIKAWTNAANIYSNLGKPRQALQLSGKVLQAIKPETHPVDYVHICLRMASDWMQLGKNDSAEVYVRKTLPIAESLHLLPRLRDAYDMLSWIAYYREDYKLAYSLRNRYVLYKDSVLQREKIQQIIELETKYEATQREKQIADLTQRSKIARLEQDNQRLAIAKAAQELEKQQQEQMLKLLQSKKETAEYLQSIYQLRQEKSKDEIEKSKLESRILMERFWLAATIVFILFVSIIVAVFFYRYHITKQHEMQRRDWVKQQALLQELRHKEQLRGEMLQAEIKAIKAQMNPHFIFNTLNSIQYFIFKDDKRQANYYLGQFSRLMRAVLDMSDMIHVSLQKELELLSLYAELESLRLQDVHFYLEIAPDVEPDNIFLASMLIQPHIENAFKHGLRHRRTTKNLWLRVLWEKKDQVLKIEVEDDGIGREASRLLQPKELLQTHRSFSTLANERRLRLLHSEQIQMATQITDKYHPDGSAAGTLVALLIPVYLDA